MDFNFSTESIIPDAGNSITIGGTGSLVLPNGTSAQRPQSPILGAMRYNSTTNGAEVYGGSTPNWTPLISGGGGGSFSGVLDFSLNANGYAIYNLLSGVNSGDAINKSQLDAHAGDYGLHLTSTQNTWIDAITTTSAEINYLGGTTSNIQTQINSKQPNLGFTAENVAHKGAVSGYAGLDISGLVPTTQLPALAYSVNTRTGAITLTSTDVGLGNVNNTSDVSKPISTATQTALDLKQTSLGFTAENITHKGAISGYAGLNASGVVPTTQLPALAYSVAGRTGAITLTSTDVGLGNVNNTNDASKPISTLTQVALNLKQDSIGFTPESIANKGVASGYASLDLSGLVPLTQLPIALWGVHTYSTASTFPTTGNVNSTYIDTTTEFAYYWNGTTYMQFSGGSGGGASTGGGVSSINNRTGIVTLTAADVGLENASNTTDADKPVSTATQTALNLKLNSSTYTAADVLTKLITVGGTGSLLDADTLDGVHAAGFASSTHLHAGVYQPIDADLTAIAALATNGFAKRTGLNTWAIDTSTYITANQTITLSGDATGSGTTSIGVVLANTGVLPGTYTKVTTDSKGRITSGVNLSTADVTTALGYTPIGLSGGTMTGLLTLSGLPTSSLHAATKSYVDGLISGISWKAPILDPNLYSDTTSTPPTPYTDEVYIIGSSPTGDWSGLAGHAVYYSTLTSTWVDILGRPVAIGDRFGILLENGISPIGGLSGKSKQVVQITSATPGSISYSFYVPVDNDALYVRNQLSSHFGDSYTYVLSSTSWIEFNSQVAITPGLGLSLVGSTLNIATASDNRIVVNPTNIDLASGIVTTGTYYSVTVDTYGRVTGGSNPTTISGYGITDAAPLSHVTDTTLHLTSAQNTWIDAITATSTEVNYISGTTSNIQTQINSKQSSLGFTPENATNKGIASGYAELDSSGLVPLTQLPLASWGIHTYSSLSGFPLIGGVKSTYIDTSTNYAYFWNGTTYIQISGGTGGAGGVSSVNTRTGAITLTSTDVGLGNASNTSDADKPISTATQTALNLKLNSSTYTAADVLTKLLTVDGTGSLLDADTLDGVHAAGFATSAHLHTGVYQPINADLTSILGLSSTTGFLEKLSNGVWTLNTTGGGTGGTGGGTGGNITLAGDVSGSGTSSIIVTLNASGVVAGTYNSSTQIYPITIDSTGRINDVGSALTITPSWSNITSTPTTLTGYGITDAIIANTLITADTATKITYDANGLVLSGSGLLASDIPNLDWSIITTGTPTTISGYGIILVASDIPSLDWSKITTGTPNTLTGYGITNAIVANTLITADTATKITYDAKGLVLSGSGLLASDIPNLDWSKITTGFPNTLSGYGITNAVTSNDPIISGTATKITYDVTGLVLSGTNLTSSDIPTLDWNKITTGKPTTVSGYGITDALTSNSSASIAGNLFSSGNISTLGNIFTVGTGSITSSNHVYDMVGDVRTATVTPISSNYTLQITDNGTCLVLTAGIITIPSNIFSMGNNITMYNNSGTTLSINCSLLTETYIAGIDVAKTTISIGPRGMCTILFYEHNCAVVSGYVQ